MSEPKTSDPAIIEAAARAMCDRPHLLRGWDDTPEKARDWYRQLAFNAITVVTPLIRTAALEEAAKVAEEFPAGGAPWLTEPPFATKHIAARIRGLKPASPAPSAASA